MLSSNMSMWLYVYTLFNLNKNLLNDDCNNMCCIFNECRELGKERERERERNK